MPNLPPDDSSDKPHRQSLAKRTRGKWKWVSPAKCAAETERFKRIRRRRCARDPAYKAKLIAKIARMIEGQGNEVRYGPSGWPYAAYKRVRP
jgi:hypothetical protein